MVATLRLQEFRFIEINESWISDASYLSNIYSLFENTRWGSAIRFYYRLGNDQMTSVNSIAEMIQNTMLGGYDTYIYSNTSDDDPDWRVYIEVHERGFEIIVSDYVIFDRDTLNSVLNEMIEFTKNIYSIFENRTLFGYRTGVELYEVPRYELNHASVHPYWTSPKIVDFISRKFHRLEPFGQPENAEVFFTINIPECTIEIFKNDLCILRWGGGLDNFENINNALEFRDKWIRNNIN